jgi:hypothetical protein
MLEERQNYLSILSIGNDVIKSSYEEATKEYAAEKCGGEKKVYRYVMQFIIENMLFVWILWCFWYLSAFLKM